MNMRRYAGAFAFTWLLAVQAACGGAKGPGAKSPADGEGGAGGAADVSKAALSKFDRALDAFVEHDRAGDWSAAVCESVANLFDEAVAENGTLSQATFNAGLAYQRCNDDAKARAKFEHVVKTDPKFHHARAQLALYDFRSSSNEDAAIASLEQAVKDAQFQNVPALVNLAMFQMQRDGSTGQADCRDDMACAKRNLQRALAIDDAYMPALNQLALYYFQLAKKRAGAPKVSSGGVRGRQVIAQAAAGKRADQQQLELAALVCSQAIRKNPNYAPIHNTAGLIHNELGQLNSAVKSFSTAAALDPKFFEAHMNLAAINLGFRGFEQAQAAYTKALAIRPNDYEAHLGMALALRGPITGAEPDFDQRIAAVQAELDAAKRVDSSRPDVLYNEGILTHELRAKGSLEKDKQKAFLKQAQQSFQQFVDRVSGRPEYESASKRARDRIQDIDDTLKFLDSGVEAQGGS